MGEQKNNNVMMPPVAKVGQVVVKGYTDANALSAAKALRCFTAWRIREGNSMRRWKMMGREQKCAF